MSRDPPGWQPAGLIPSDDAHRPGWVAVLHKACPSLDGLDRPAQDASRRLQGPSADNWLGTDALGRDIFSRLLFGARTAALVAAITTVISLLLGVSLGTAAGFLGGRVDAFIMWVTDVTMSIPGLLLAMLVNTALLYPIQRWFDERYQATRNPFYLNTLWLDFVLVFGTLALIAWPEFARLIRGQVLSIGHMPYIEAARSIGTPLVSDIERTWNDLAPRGMPSQ